MSTTDKKGSTSKAPLQKKIEKWDARAEEFASLKDEIRGWKNDWSKRVESATQFATALPSSFFRGNSKEDREKLPKKLLSPDRLKADTALLISKDPSRSEEILREVGKIREKKSRKDDLKDRLKRSATKTPQIIERFMESGGKTKKEQQEQPLADDDDTEVVAAPPPAKKQKTVAAEPQQASPPPPAAKQEQEPQQQPKVPVVTKQRYKPLPNGGLDTSVYEKQQQQPIKQQQTPTTTQT